MENSEYELKCPNCGNKFFSIVKYDFSQNKFDEGDKRVFHRVYEKAENILKKGGIRYIYKNKELYYFENNKRINESFSRNNQFICSKCGKTNWWFQIELEEISKNSTGTVTVEDGIYTGEIKNGIPDGRGKLIYNGVYDGDIYQGDFKNGKPDGKGIYYHHNGNRYEGDFKNDKADGKGIFYFANGNRYEGDWKEDAREGQGTLYYANGDRMIGDYHNDKPIGKHAILYANGNISQKIF